MANRRLTAAELAAANDLLRSVREQLARLSADDSSLLWALRRKVYKELTYDERGKPTYRRKLKARKRVAQGGRCAVCGEALPENYAVLDRLEAMGGYTEGNTQLIHQECDTAVQRSRGYA